MERGKLSMKHCPEKPLATYYLSLNHTLRKIFEEEIIKPKYFNYKNDCPLKVGNDADLVSL